MFAERDYLFHSLPRARQSCASRRPFPPRAFPAISRKILDFDCLDTFVLRKKLEKNRKLRCRRCCSFHRRSDSEPQGVLVCANTLMIREC